MPERGVTFPIYFVEPEWCIPLMDMVALVKSVAERYPSSEDLAKDLAAELLRVVEKIMDSDYDGGYMECEL